MYTNINNILFHELAGILASSMGNDNHGSLSIALPREVVWPRLLKKSEGKK